MDMLFEERQLRVQDLEEQLAVKCLERSLDTEIVQKLKERRDRRNSNTGASEASDELDFSSCGSLGTVGPKTDLTFGEAATAHTMDSQLQFAEANQTIIIFDWDDTLCPSTCIKSHAHMNEFVHRSAFEAVNSELQLLAEQVVPLIRAAQMMGQVVIVTNAMRPWVEKSCQRFLPAVCQELADVPVIYALELVKDITRHSAGQVDNAWLLTETKARAMKAAVSEFYSRYPNQSWKNLVTIGDALFEHDAIRQVARDRPMSKRCRIKTLKLIEEPTIPGLVVQLSIVKKWLMKVVCLDGDIDIDLAADQATVNSWCRMFA